MTQTSSLLLSFFCFLFLPTLLVHAAVETCTSDYTTCINNAQNVQSNCNVNLFSSCETTQNIADQQCTSNQNICLMTSSSATCTTAYNSCTSAAKSAESTCESNGYSACSSAYSTASGRCIIAQSQCNSSPSALNTPCYAVQQDCVKGYSIVIDCCNASGETDCSTRQSQYAANCQAAYSKGATTCSIGDTACCDAVYQSFTGTSKEDATAGQDSCTKSTKKRDLELDLDSEGSKEERVKMMSKRRMNELLRGMR